MNQESPLVEMTYPELKDFLGTKNRKATHEEVSAIVRDMAVRMYGQAKEGVTFDQFLENMTNEMYQEVEECSRVFDFSSVGKKILFFLGTQLLLVNDDENPGDQNTTAAVKKHNHLFAHHNVFSIDQKNEVTLIMCLSKDICLSTTK